VQAEPSPVSGVRNAVIGWVQVTTRARLDRLNLILAVAIILLSGLGLVARGRFQPGVWFSSNDPRECRGVTAGRRMWDRIDVPPDRLLDDVVQATLASVPKWG
jgi:hypothetical protein